MDKELLLSIEKELELAEDYALGGPEEWNPEDVKRCLQNAKRLAKKSRVDISKDVKRIEKLWATNCKAGNLIYQIGKPASDRNLNIENEIRDLKSKFYEWTFLD